MSQNAYSAIAIALPHILAFGLFLSTLTLFAKTEKWRSLGRVLLGLVLIGAAASFGLRDFMLTYGGIFGLTLFSTAMVGLSGLITLGSGLRKFARRNLPSNS